VSELRGKDVRVRLPAGSGRRGCPGETERVSWGNDTNCGPRIATKQGVQLLPTEGATGTRDGIQGDCLWEHRRRSSAPRLLTRLSLDEGVLGSSRSYFLSRESLTASQRDRRKRDQRRECESWKQGEEAGGDL
jgi:hypothetical protein